jgi:hypothetical protein
VFAPPQEDLAHELRERRVMVEQALAQATNDLAGRLDAAGLVLTRELSERLDRSLSAVLDRASVRQESLVTEFNEVFSRRWEEFLRAATGLMRPGRPR